MDTSVDTRVDTRVDTSVSPVVTSSDSVEWVRVSVRNKEEVLRVLCAASRLGNLKVLDWSLRELRRVDERFRWASTVRKGLYWSLRGDCVRSLQWWIAKDPPWFVRHFADWRDRAWRWGADRCRVYIETHYASLRDAPDAGAESGASTAAAAATQ